MNIKSKQQERRLYTRKSLLQKIITLTIMKTKGVCMNASYTKFFSLMAVTITAVTLTDGMSPTLVYRSQAFDKARKVVGVEDKTHLDRDTRYGELQVIFDYTQSFRPRDIAHNLFGNSLQSLTLNNSTSSCSGSCLDNLIFLQGSNVDDRNAKAWLADYFYLPADYDGYFRINPTIKNFIVDFDYYVGLDELYCGGYFRLYAPFVHTRWNLDFCEKGSFTNSESGQYSLGYFSSDFVITSQLLHSFSEYANGAVPTLNNDAGTTPTYVAAQGLQFAKFDQCARSKNGLGDLRAELGWNFLQRECSHLGVNLQFAAPTGNKRRAKFAFDPIVGNGHHWEFGGGIIGHHILWSNDTDTNRIGVYLDVNITHLFKAHEQRTFDLKNKPNSRYMLAAKFGPNVDDNLTGSTGISAVGVFANEYAPVANLTTLDLSVSAGVQADVVLWLNYTSCNWSYDIGYNFFGRSKETFSLDSCANKCATSLCDENQRNTWVLKGDARVYGQLSTNEFIALSASESVATICGGTNRSSNADVANTTVDNSQPALFQGNPVELPFSSDPISTSIQPVFLSCDDIDFARTRSISNKVFAHVNYTWECECLSPFFGLGGFAEFGSNDSCSNSCNSDGCTSTQSSNACNTDSCSGNNGSTVKTSLTQWGVWLKGGLAFE
jgi:hypothetical protein